MAKLFCRFCCNVFDHDVIGFVICPRCEFASDPSMFQLVEWSVEESLALWNRLEDAMSSFRSSPDVLRAAFFPQGNDPPWSRLLLESLIYDQLLVFERWKCLYNPTCDFTPIFEELVNAGVVVPVEDPQTLSPIGSFGSTAPKIWPDWNRMLELTKTPGYFSVFDCTSLDTGSPSYTYTLLDWLANLQASYIWNRNAEAMNALRQRHSEVAEEGGLVPDLFDTMRKGMRFQAAAVVLDCQLSFQHKWVELLFFQEPNVKPPLHEIVNEVIFESQFMFSPRVKDVRRFLDLRASPPVLDLRKHLRHLRTMSPEELKMCAKDIRDTLKDEMMKVNDCVSRIGNYVELSTTGLLATAGSLFGGLPGAVIGGIGGSLLGKTTATAMQAILKRRNRTWAMLIERFKHK